MSGFPTVLAHGVTYLTSMTAACAARAAEPGLTPGEVLWLEELHTSQISSLEMVTRVHALLSRSMMSSSLGAYTAAAGMLLEFMIAHVVTAHACFRERCTWVADLAAKAGAEAGGSDAGQLVKHKPLLQLTEVPTALLMRG